LQAGTVALLYSLIGIWKNYRLSAPVKNIQFVTCQIAKGFLAPGKALEQIALLFAERDDLAIASRAFSAAIPERLFGFRPGYFLYSHRCAFRYSKSGHLT
jgi:hypothetical protein